MKRFSFMIAFFVGVLVFLSLHKAEKPICGSEQQLHLYNDEYASSVGNSSVMALISSGVAYFGVSGLLRIIVPKKPNHREFL